MNYIPIIEFINELLTLLPYILFAAMGGLVGMCVNGSCDKPLTIKVIYQRVLLSTFTGLIVFFGLQDVAWMSDNWTVIAVGLSGFVATDILPEVKHFVAGKLKEKLIIFGDKK